MNSIHISTRALRATSSRCIAACCLLAFMLCRVNPASADQLSFHFEWSGESFGNSARATGTIAFDDSLLRNPGDNHLETNPGYVTDLSITVTGASSGNGSWNLADYFDVIWQTDAALDLSKELVGQPTSVDPWGTSRPGGTYGDFTLFPMGVTAPGSTWFFELTTNAGLGDEKMLLTSFRPVPEPSGATLGLIAVVLMLFGSTVRPSLVVANRGGFWFMTKGFIRSSR